MAKATIKMPDGTLVEIQGTTGEIERLLEFYAARGSAAKSGIIYFTEQPARSLLCVDRPAILPRQPPR